MTTDFQRARPHRLLAAVSALALLPAFALAQAPAAPPAQAQAPAQAPPKPAPAAPAKAAPGQPDKSTAVQGVTVQGAPQAAVRSSIDRRSYSVSTDLRGSSGSVADALRNIPGAEVDVNGNLSLRGGPVQIMVDGQPSQLFSGPAGAQVLQTMPADRLDRVEVITNPTAAFSPEGGAGIINLVTKKTAPGGLTGGLRANYGSSGHANGSGNIVYQKKKLTVIADVGLRQDPQKLEIDTTGTAANPFTGQPEQRAQHEVTNVPQKGWNGHVGLTYQLDPKTQLTADGRFNSVGVNRYDDFAFLSTNSSGAPISAYRRDASDNTINQNTAIGQVMLRHQFPGSDHNIVAFYNHTQINYRAEAPSTNLITIPPPPASTYQDIFARIRADVNQFKADYTRPMPHMAQLKAGYDLRTIDAAFNNFGIAGPDALHALPQPLSNNLFGYHQMVNAAYVTYERPVGEKLTVLGGLRLEDEQLHLDQITQATKVDRDDVRVFPSLHFAYRTSPTTQWTLNYSERIQRPNPQDLNPWRNLIDPFNISMGNPNLDPQVTHSIEGAWNYRKGAKSYLATLFYRQSDNGVTNVVTSLGNGVLLTTKENQSSGKTAGLELVAAAPITKKIDYNISTNIYWNQLSGPVAATALVPTAAHQTRQNWTASGRGNVTWNPTKNDQVQASAQINAGRLTPQGHQDPLYVMYFGYRHKFTNAFSLVAQAQDPFDLVRQYSYLESPGLNQKTVLKAHIQSFMIGFTYAFGGNGRPQRDQGFDFNAAPAAIPGG